MLILKGCILIGMLDSAGAGTQGASTRWKQRVTYQSPAGRPAELGGSEGAAPPGKNPDMLQQQPTDDADDDLLLFLLMVPKLGVP